MSKFSKGIFSLALGAALISSSMIGLSFHAEAAEAQSDFGTEAADSHTDSASEASREHPRYENVRRGMYEQPGGSDHQVRPGMYEQKS